MTELLEETSPTHHSRVPTYLKSPILTLLAFLEDDDDDLTVHDVLDAYHTLFLRIRFIAPTLESAHKIPPAVTAVSHTFDALSRCFQRDIRRAVCNPVKASQNSPDLSKGNIGLPGIQIPDEQLCELRYTTRICQLAIQVASVIFRFPALYSAFTDDALSHLMDDLLSVARATELPTIDYEKTSAAAACVFYTLRIPMRMVSQKKEVLLQWMHELADCMSSATDGSKIIYHLLCTYPAVFLQQSLDLLPEFLLGLTNSTRTDVTVALCGFARAVLSPGSHVNSELKSTLVSKVYSFLIPQLPSKPGLPQSITLALKGDSGDPTGARWAATVICALIVLSGHNVFSSNRFCRFVLSAAETLTQNKCKYKLDLMVCIWRCLVRAFFGIPATVDSVNASGAQSSSATVCIPTHRQVVLNIVKQELRDGIGTCLVAGLLNAPNGDGHEFDQAAAVEDVSMAISILKDMVSHKEENIYHDGFRVLEKILSAIGAPSSLHNTCVAHNWTPDDIIITTLFARQLLAAPGDQFYASLHTAMQFDMAVIKQLTECEIKRHWKELAEVWTLCAQRELQKGNYVHPPDALLHAWQALLLVQTELTQERRHLTPTHDFSGTPIEMVGSFMHWALELQSPLSPSAIQHRTLLFCSQLWGIMRNVYSEEWLVSAAGSLLTLTVQYSFELADEEVKTVWSRFFIDLVSLSEPGCVTRLVVESEGRHALDTGRKLWEMMAQTWMKRPPSATDSVDFLGIPMRLWTMSDEETDLWNDVLEHTLALASTTASSIGVLAELMNHGCANIEGDGLLTASKLAVLLLPHLQISGKCDSLQQFLARISIILLGLYVESSGHRAAALEMCKRIRTIVQRCPVDTIFTVVSALAAGLAVWIGDAKDLLQIQEHNEIIVPLYCDALTALRDIPFSSDTLQALAHFFYAAFIRIPEPGKGPDAFYHFWSHIQPTLGDMKGVYPEEIKTTLRACHDVFAIELPSDMSLGTDSHTDSPAKGSSALGSPSVYRAGGANSRISAWPNSPLPPSSPPETSPATSPFSTPRRSKRLHDQLQSSAGRSDGDGGQISYMPSSPTDALHARRMVAGRAGRVAHERPAHSMDRPLKRQKLVSPLKITSNSISPPGGEGASNPAPLPSVKGPRSRMQPREDDRVDDKRKKGRTSATDSATTTPQALKRKAAVLSPEAPSPTTSAKRRARVTAAHASSSDDYDAWERPVCVEDDLGIVPDSQSSGGSDDGDSLLTSFMKAKAFGRESSAQATTILDDEDDRYEEDDARAGENEDKTWGKRPVGQGPTSLRTRTAPGSFLRREPSPPVGEPSRSAVPLRRARTASAQLEELRYVCDALEQDGSQMRVDDMLAATALASRLGALMSEKLTKKLSKGSVGAGPSRKGQD